MATNGSKYVANPLQSTNENALIKTNRSIPDADGANNECDSRGPNEDKSITKGERNLYEITNAVINHAKDAVRWESNEANNKKKSKQNDKERKKERNK